MRVSLPKSPILQSQPQKRPVARSVGTVINQGSAPRLEKTATRARTNHFAKMCRAKESNNYIVAERPQQMVANGETDSEPSEFSYFAKKPGQTRNGKMHTVQIQGVQLQMMEDTGASVTVISETMWKQLGEPILDRRADTTETYDNHVMEILGRMHTELTWNNNNYPVTISVVKCNRNFGLLGRDVLSSDVSIYNINSSSHLLKGITASVKLNQ